MSQPCRWYEHSLSVYDVDCRCMRWSGDDRLYLHSIMYTDNGSDVTSGKSSVDIVDAPNVTVATHPAHVT